MNFPIIYEKNSSALRDDKYIADVKIQVLKMFYKDRPNYPRVLSNPSERYRAELEFIMQNNFRNDVLAKLCNKLDKNGLIMVDYIDHGTTLHKHLTKMCPEKKVYFIRGEVEVEERDKIKKIMEKGVYYSKSGRPGPVLVDIPKDIQFQKTSYKKFNKQKLFLNFYKFDQDKI